MKKFVALIANLDQSSSAEKQKSTLIEYFSIASDSDKLWAVALLLRKRPKRIVPIKTLQIWAIEKVQFPVWLFEETYKIFGDLSETVAKILPPAENQIDKSLCERMLELDQLHNKELDFIKEKVIKTWTELTQNERFIYIKLLAGSFRYEVSQKTLAEALATYLQQEPKDMAYRMMSKWHPLSSSFKSLFVDNNYNSEYSKPYPFYLAEALDSELDSLGNPEEWLVEYLWDGVRGQLIKRADKVNLWTRADELITEQCPEFNSLATLPIDFVIDGVLMIEKEGNIEGLDAVKQRLGRKTLTKKLLAELPLVFLAFDLIELDGKNLMSTKQIQRKAQLEILIQEFSNLQVVLFSENLSFNSWPELRKLKTKTSGIKANGLIIKAKNGSYKAGSRGSDWLKWKADPIKAFLVLIYVEKANRTNLFTEFTFAAKEGDSFVPIAKLKVDLPEVDMQEISRFVKENTIEKFGPVRQIKPELMFEITFQGLSLSKRRKAGIVLRSPQIKCWRQDILVAEITHLSKIKEIL